VDELLKIPNIKCIKPKGAFYAMPNVSYYLANNKKIKNSADLCEYLLKEYKIAVVPGSAFGADKYVRFSYATSTESIKKGVKRFKKGLLNLLK
jgi:aspartate aminotransferase